MQTFEFKVLCANRKESCRFVKSLMPDFKIKDASTREIYDHVGIRDFENPDLAIQRLKELESRADNKIKNIVLSRVR